MGIFGNKDIINIEEDDIKDAKLSAIDFEDEQTKQRAFADILGARLAMKLLFERKINATNLYSIYTIQSILKNLDIADIYCKDIKIDVRLVFNPDEIFIPKSHFKNKILPDVYVVLHLKEDLSSAEFLGFFEPNNLDKINQNKDFYFVEKIALRMPNQFRKFLDKYQVPTVKKSTKAELERAESLFIKVIDENISSIDKMFLYQQLAKNFTLREKFVEFENFELMSTKAGEDKGLLNDGVLDIVGTQKIHENDIEDEDIIEELAKMDKEAELEAKLEEELKEKEAQEQKAKKKQRKILEPAIGKITEIAGDMSLAGAAAMAGITAGNSANMITNAANVIDNSFDTTEAVIASAGEFIESFSETIPSFSDETLHENEANEIFKEEVSNEGINLAEIEKIADFDDFIEIEEPKFLKELINENIQNIVEEKVEEAVENKIEEKVMPKTTIKILDDYDIETGKIDEITPLESLPNIENFNEKKTNEDFIDLNNFDFSIFNDGDKKDKDSSGTTEKKEDLMSLDFLDTSKNEEIKLNRENLDSELTEIDDEVINSASSNTDILEITSQVDELLKNIETNKDDIINKIPINIVTEELAGLDLSKEAPKQETSEVIDEVEYDKTINKMPEINQSEIEKTVIQPEIEEKTTQEKLPSDFEIVKNLDFPEVAEKANTEAPDLIQALFTKEKIAEMPEELGEKKASLLDITNLPQPIVSAIQSFTNLDKKKKMIVAASFAGIMLVSATAIMNHKATNSTLPDNMNNQQTTSSSIPQDLNSNVMQPANINTDAMSANSPELSQANQGQARDMGQAVSEAFLSEPINANVSKIAWEVPEDLAYNDSFRKYLQTAGKNLKLTLQNDLLLATEMAYSNKMIVDLKINKDGSVQGANIVTSSGSKQIDGIVLQSVKETLKYLKMPASELNNQSVNATLLINF